MRSAVGCLWSAALLVTWGGYVVSAADSEPSPTAPREMRPAFVLPDVVVEGEDLSCLAGGTRLLEMELPGVKPRQEPLLVEPGPTGYRMRPSMPFQITRPPEARSPWARGLVRTTLESGPGGSASLAWLPWPNRPGLLWCDMAFWKDRLPDCDHQEGAVGWLSSGPVADPHARIGFGLRTARNRWDDPRSSRANADSSVRFVQVEGFWERMSQPYWLPAVISLRAAGGQVRTSWLEEITGGDGATRTETGSWIGAEMGMATRGSLSDLNALSRSRSRLESDLNIGVVRKTSERAPDSTCNRLRGRGNLGWSFGCGSGRLGLGVGVGGEGHDWMVGPLLMYGARWQESGILLRAEVNPQTSYAEEMLAPGGVLASCVTSALYNCGTERGVVPEVMHRNVQLPGLARINPLLAPQRAWLHVSSELLLQRDDGWMRCKLTAADLRSPLSWQRLPSAARFGVYETVNVKDRWLVRFESEGHWQIGPGIAGRMAYAWTHETEVSSDQPLLFLPAHELVSSLDGRLGSFLWGAGLHVRSRVAAGQGAEDLETILALSASVGWSLASMRVLLIGENLMDEEILYRPGDGVDGRWVRIALEYACSHSVP
ncbi:MAG: hypothetical protein KAY24_17695 [Candidatus Eisenbacteria sp.]|nr:hypothetical protein [Candidatus Eisenbacteria bacterium]